MVLTMIRMIWREMSKVWVELDTAYVSGDKVVMVGKYLWGTLHSQRVMDKFLSAKFRQNPEVAFT